MAVNPGTPMPATAASAAAKSAQMTASGTPPVMKQTQGATPTYTNMGGAGTNVPGTATPPSNPVEANQQLANAILGAAHQAVAPVNLPQQVGFTPTPAPAINPQLLNPTAQTPGVQNMMQAQNDILGAINTATQQMQALAKTHTLTGMPNFAGMGAALGSLQSGINGGVYTPHDQSQAAGTASSIQAANVRNQNLIAQRQIQELNAERARAAQTSALLSAQGHTAMMQVLANLHASNAQSLLPTIIAGKMMDQNKAGQ